MKKNKNNKQLQDELSQNVTNKIINILETHQAGNYEKTWFPPLEPFAFNPSSNITYAMVNQILLSDVYLHSENFKLNRWMTFKQAKELKGNVKKGENSTRIYFKSYLVIDVKTGHNITTKFFNLSKEVQKKLIADGIVFFKGYLKYHRIFNIEQIENLPNIFTDPPKKKRQIKGEKNTNAEKILSSYNIDIRYKENADRCFYSWNLFNETQDYIVSPIVDNYKDWTNHYKTMFHEFIHSTGNVKRLDRDMSGAKGTKKYAFEELIAEIGSAILCAHCGIDTTITNNAAYIKSWLTCLNNDLNFIFKAASKAEQAAKFILSETDILNSFVTKEEEVKIES
jgi:antirestriction protein ArdC